MNAAISYLDMHGGRVEWYEVKKHMCAARTTDAIEAGGAHIHRVEFAKDFGPSLEAAGWHSVGQTTEFQRGDIAVIQPPHGQSPPAGHMCMFDGHDWISDFHQTRGGGISGMYPGPSYRIERPPYKIYRR
jgi:hypothetical protein